MGCFQSTLKRYGNLLAGVLLTLILGAGCVAQNAETKPDQAMSGEPEKQVAEVSADPQAPRLVTGIRTMNGEDGLTLWIDGNRPMEYSSIKQVFPFAISVYLPDTGVAEGLSPEVPESEDIGGIRLEYADKEKTTAKLQILLNRDMAYHIQEQGNSLEVVISPQDTEVSDVQDTEVATIQVPPESVEDTETVQADNTAGSSGTVKNVETKPVTKTRSAEVTHIELSGDSSGLSDLRISTTAPVRYEARDAGPGQINLILFDTRIPQINQRTLQAQYVNSAVSEVLPAALPEESKDACIFIKIRKMVPYQLVQEGNALDMIFEPAEPPVQKTPKAVADSAGGKNAGASAAGNSVQAAKKKTEPADEEESILGKKPVYTGEKIKLDFYETDVKNVFRILKTVSGLNFAIDDNVQGKVTLSFEKPVPWDQVMDLVLKMNGLGKKVDGNVIRIATVETLTREDNDLQAAIAARKKAMEQKVSLEPLVTEYIPINYSSAEEDIKPHVEKILTPDRGKVSIDSRTNMVIVTDTQTKIDQVQDLIFRLDTVTPQIMIEARVVEVTKEFSRNIGLNWNLSNASAVTSNFVDDFNVAVNTSEQVGLSGDYSFFRLFGSSMTALNAQLEASEELGDVKIVSSPRILTLDNKKAMIKQGSEYAYLERDDSGGSSVEFKDVDLLLEVTPHVTPDKRISMTVHLTKNDVASVTSDGVPTLATNEAQTELLVNDNETVVIGGVVKKTTSDYDNGVPFLRGIPVLGRLFGTNQKSDDRTELLIFLTPAIVQLEQRLNVNDPVNFKPETQGSGTISVNN